MAPTINQVFHPVYINRDLAGVFFLHTENNACTGLVQTWGAIHSTKISGNFGPKLRFGPAQPKKFRKTGSPFEVDEVDHF